MKHCPLIGSLTLTVLLIFSLAVSAQTQRATAHSESPAEVALKVTGLSGKLELRKEIVLNVANLSEWALRHDPQKLVPFINGRSLNGLYPQQVDLSRNQVRFQLLRTPATQHLWKEIFQDALFSRRVALSLGLEGQAPVETVFDYDHKVPLTIIPLTWGSLSLAVIVLVLVAFVYFARTTNLLRDPGAKLEAGAYRPYNLGRAQMAFWFLLITFSFVFIWLVTGDTDTIGRSHLSLLGISSATAVGSHIATRSDADAGPPVSQGFLIDMLSDSSGVRFHRFQLCAWTLIMGLLFGITVFNDLVMVEFRDTELALIAISAGTYLGFTYLETKPTGERDPVDR